MLKGKLLKKQGKAGLPIHNVPPFILERVGFLLNRAGQRIREVTEEALKDHQLIGKHLGILTMIHEKGAIPQHEIGGCMSIDRTTMVDMIDDLEKKGLVERRENPSDRRAYALALTAKGKEILPKVQKIGLEVERQFLSHLSAKDQKELIRILQKLVLFHLSQTKS